MSARAKTQRAQSATKVRIGPTPGPSEASSRKEGR
jgi:hypothetical protein